MNEEMVSLWISPETLKEVAEETGFNLAIPETATQKGDRYERPGVLNAKFTATWNEIMQITSAEIVRSDGDTPISDGAVQVRVRAKVEGGGNGGRNFSMFYHLFPKALTTRAKTPERTRSLMAIGRMNELLNAVGYGVDGTGVDYGQYFSGGAPVVVGMKVNVMVKHRVHDGKEYQEAQRFSGV